MTTLTRVNHLSRNFYTNPANTTQTMTLREWQETALYTEGWILAIGHMWDLKAKRIAPGVYVVTAKKR